MSGMRLSLETSQNTSQVQKTVILPQMILSAKLLLLPKTEFEEQINQEIEENPLLELNDESNESADFDSLSDESLTSSNDASLPDLNTSSEYDESDHFLGETPLHNKDNADDFEVADDFASLYDDTINEQPIRSQDWIENASEQHYDMISNLPSSDQSLQTHLIEQLHWFELSPEMQTLCETIINNLDTNGYLIENLANLIHPESDTKTSSTNQETVEKSTLPHELPLWKEALSIVQSLEPKGVGARNLKECLLLQLTPGTPYEEEAKTLILHHLEDLEHNRFPLISKATGYSFSRIQDALLEIQALNPRPGVIFSQRAAQPVIPDVYVEPALDGTWNIRVDNGRYDSLHISPYYLNLLKHDPHVDASTKNYLRKNMENAQNLIEAIGRRRTTLLKVVQEILAYQKDFLQSGPDSIHPLILKQIADKLGIHESTVSRACDDKWIQTPFGIFPLKRFFERSAANGPSSSVESPPQDELAQTTVCQRLKKIIDLEDKSRPYSDEELVELMKKGGIHAARRTITKYRKLINIPDSRQRRRWVQS